MSQKNKKNSVGISGKVRFGNLYNKSIFRRSQGDFLKEIKKIAKDEFQIDNFNLYLNKYVPVIEATVRDNHGEKKWFSLGLKCIGAESKKPFLEALVEKKFDFNECLKKIKIFIDEQKNSFKNQKYELVFSGSVKTKSRLVIGLGSTNVLETSITLHHTYGIPYIPATALKGILRMVIFLKIAEDKGVLNDEGKLNDLQKEFFGGLSADEKILKYQLLFGAKNFRGLLLFFDAYPELAGNEQIFDLDIINVHYPGYYSDKEGKIAPGDWENPNPVFFLALKEGIKFNIIIFFDKFRAEEVIKMTDDNFEKKGIPKMAKEIINEFNKENLFSPNDNLISKALKNFGIGAKTRLGYGIFE